MKTPRYLARQPGVATAIAASLAALLALNGCVEPVSPGASTADGRAASTFVSLNPCIDAILAELAEPSQILALSHYSSDPASTSIRLETAALFASTGGTVEEVLAIDPDIVLASSFIAPSTRAAFERLGIRVETFDSPSTPDESFGQIRRLGRMTGHDDRASDLIAAIATALERAGSGGRVKTVLWQSGEIVAGEEALISRVLASSGFVRGSSVADLPQGSSVSLEELLADPPELLLVAGDGQGQLHPVLSRLEKTQVRRLDPQLFYCGGPSLIALADRLEDIRTGLPE